MPTNVSKGYSIKNKKEIVKLLKKYKLQAFMESFTDVWEELDYYDRDGSPNKKSSFFFFNRQNPLLTF